MQITATVLDDDTISLDGRTLTGKDAITSGLTSALETDPNLTLIIRPMTLAGHYKGIGTVIYASQRVGMPVENLRVQMDDGEVLSFDELRARNPMPPAEH